MDIAFIIFIITLAIYIPIASVLLYVWWKYGKGEIGVSIARVVFLVVSILIIGYIITI